MHLNTPLLVTLAFGGLASAYPSFVTDPNLNTVKDWKRAAAEIKAAKFRAESGEGIPTLVESGKVSVGEIPDDAASEKRDVLEARQAATMTRGSQSNPTDPCYNVYNYPAPTDCPTGQGPDGSYGFGYQAPGSNDVRSPCPGLNTLANHGYLNRDGRAINGSAIVDAFITAWGIDQSVITIAKTNALAICTFESGGSENDASSEVCESFDLNVLNAPHTFEHDHSMSRNDYQESWSNAPVNNHIFNGTVFNQTLNVLNNSCYMTIDQAQEMRLQREVNQFLIDKGTWFTLAPSTMLTEIGFVFAAMSEVNQPGGNGIATEAQVRVDWWQYWFMYESFPTDLGWQVPSPLVEKAFVASISSLIKEASITSTPAPFYTEFIDGPTGTFPSTSQSGTVFFNPTLGNIYSTALQNNFAKRDYVEATPTPVTPVRQRDYVEGRATLLV